MIKHAPILDIDRVVEHYSQKDGVPIKYVLTTEVKLNNTPCDIFFRDTPHPEFGNRYFGLRRDIVHGDIYIFGADSIEGAQVAMVEDSKGDLYYSAYRHDYKTLDNGNIIDGGRAYVKSNTGYRTFTVTNGELVEDA